VPTLERNTLYIFRVEVKVKLVFYTEMATPTYITTVHC